MPAYPPESWRALFPFLELWQALSLDQRRHALGLHPVYQALPKPLASLPPHLLDALFESDAKGRHRPLPGFNRVLALLNRLSKWSLDQGPDLATYLTETTTYAQRLALSGVPKGSRADLLVPALERRMVGGWFTRALLQEKSEWGFFQATGSWASMEPELTQERYTALRAWVMGQLEEGRTGFLMLEGTFQVPGRKVPPEELITLLLAYGIAFPGLYPDTLDPVVQIMVPMETPAQSVEQVEVRNLEAREAFLRPFLLDDIDAVLRTVKAEPMPLLSDGLHPPMAQLRRLGKSFLPLPDFLPKEGFAGEHRAMAAWWMILQMECLTGSGRSPKTYRAHLNPKGQDWLSLSREEKLKRALKEIPVGRRRPRRLGDWFSWLGEHIVHPFPYAALNAGLIDWLDGTVERLALPVGAGEPPVRRGSGPVADPADAVGAKPGDFALLLESAVRKANPFRDDMDRDPLLDGRWAQWEASPEEVYGRLLSHHLARLASLGAISFTRDRQGRVGVTLAGVGPWLYGKAEDWTLPGEARAVAVVGADFEITFLEPDAGLAAELTPFAEPLSKAGGAGAAFRLTRKSVQAGVHHGLSAEEMVDILRKGSKTAVPSNVIHEVKHWAGAKRTVALTECILVECDDPLILAELRSQLPKDFAVVSPQALRYTGTSGSAALAKRLARKGFFTG